MYNLVSIIKKKENKKENMKIKVLVVDDNVGLVGLIKEYFKDSKDIEIISTASNGEEVVDIFERGDLDFDLILLDLIMPKKDGISVLHYMKEHKINKKENKKHED